MSTAAPTIVMVGVAIGRTGIVKLTFLIGKGVRDWEELEVVQLGFC